MATLDRFVEAMSRQRGEALVFRPGAAPELIVAGATRLVSSRVVTAEQIEQLVGEVLGPGVLAGLGGGRGSFAYQGPFGAVTIQLAQGAGGWHARVLPAAERAGRGALAPRRHRRPRGRSRSRSTSSSARCST